MKTIESKFIVIEFLKHHNILAMLHEYVEYAPNRQELKSIQMLSDEINNNRYFYEYHRDDGIIENHIFTNIVIARWTIYNLKRAGYKMENFKYIGKK